MIDVILLNLARVTTYIFRQFRNRLLNRIFIGSKCAVWELPYSHPESTRILIAQLNGMFPKGSALKKLILLVNNGKDGSFEVFVIGAFDEKLRDKVQPEINKIPNVLQTFTDDPMLLVSMAARGHYRMAVSNVNPSTVDKLYGKQ